MSEPTGSEVKDTKKPAKNPGFSARTDNAVKTINWPVSQDRHRLRWFPARQRLIGLVRGSRDSFVLPPAVVRKASWRE